MYPLSRESPFERTDATARMSRRASLIGRVTCRGPSTMRIPSGRTKLCLAIDHRTERPISSGKAAEASAVSHQREGSSGIRGQVATGKQQRHQRTVSSVKAGDAAPLTTEAKA